MSFFRAQASLKSFILEAAPNQSLVRCSHCSLESVSSHGVCTPIIYIRKRDYTSALDMVRLFPNKYTPADVRQKQLPHPSPPYMSVSSRSQQEMIRFYESVLRFSQISWLPVNASWSAEYRRHPLSRADTSVCGRAPRETSVTRRWMEMYQQRINTPNNFPSSLPLCNRCQSVVELSLPWCNVVPLLFIYLPHSRTCLEWMRKTRMYTHEPA